MRAVCRMLFAALAASSVLSGVQAGENASAAVAAAVGDARRPAADRERDAQRKPAEVLTFFAVEPGMVVLDVFSGGGYYAEILSRLVGSGGKVLALNNAAYVAYLGTALDERYAGGRLANVERLDVEIDAARFPPESLDAVLMVLAFHDLYWVVDDGSWPRIDAPAFLAELYRALAPGGVLGVIDHAAMPGTGAAEVAGKHRIDTAFARRALEEAGFVLEAECDALRNADDDHSLPVTAPAVRGRTDRFCMRFRKPDAVSGATWKQP